MQSEGLRAQIGYKRRPGKYGTQPAVVAANQLQQDFNINAPDTVWVTDIPYIRTHEGWLVTRSVKLIVPRSKICARRPVN